MRSPIRFVAVVLAMMISAGALVAFAVTYGDRIVTRTGDDASGDGNVLQSTALPRDCSAQPSTSADPIAGGDAGGVLIELSRRLYPCADRVVVAAPDPSARWTAARLATDEGAPLLLRSDAPDSQLLHELRRLTPDEVILIGALPGTTEAFAGDWILTERPADPAAQPPNPAGGGDTLWVVNGGAPDLSAMLSPLASQVGAGIVELAPLDDPASPDLFTVAPDIVGRLRAAEVVQLIGRFSETDIWQLDVLQTGIELPGGGLTILPDRRYIAFYGSPGTSLLGVLGEQDPAATVERMQPLLADYRTDDGIIVVPTFELIATVAASEAGDDGDYSNETPVAALRPYVDFAADNGIYVLLDLQPGRTDFLTQAKLYEELLVQPHVGLALDPEWRLAPDQVHLRQFGSVDAVEVNDVSAWLAELVRQNALPQKMLLIHQFKQSMVTNRWDIEDRPELSLVIQMDGQGPLGTKYGTLAALVRGGENGPWRWGWKNFYDEDMPMASPAQTLAVEPQPVYVSYQ